MQRPCIEDGTIIDGELCGCKFWVHIVGKHPQSGADQDLWDCSFSWMPVLLIDNTQKQRETGAAVESFRNEMIKANTTNQHLLLTVANIANTPLLEPDNE